MRTEAFFVRQWEKTEACSRPSYLHINHAHSGNAPGRSCHLPCGREGIELVEPRMARHGMCVCVCVCVGASIYTHARRPGLSQHQYFAGVVLTVCAASLDMLHGAILNLLVLRQPVRLYYTRPSSNVARTRSE